MIGCWKLYALLVLLLHSAPSLGVPGIKDGQYCSDCSFAHDGYCFKDWGYKYSQARAENECKIWSPGGHLAWLLSQEEHNMIVSYITKYRGNDTWYIGLLSGGWVNEWKWSSGDRLSWKNWMPQRPLSAWYKYFCGVMKGDTQYKMMDISCSEEHFFLCKAPCTECPDGTYGKDCARKCSSACKINTCDPATGICDCDEHATVAGPKCEDTCKGNCLGFCYQNFTCKNGCEKGSYGQTCESRCSKFCIDDNCDRLEGTCSSKNLCRNFSRGGSRCDQPCPLNCTGCYQNFTCLGCIPGMYGPSCSNSCHPNCRIDGNYSCYQQDGQCDQCAGKRSYGPQCRLNCSKVCINEQCEKSSGSCICQNHTMGGLRCDEQCPESCAHGCYKNLTCRGCVSGKHGPSCSDDCPLNCRGNDTFSCSQYDGSCDQCLENFWGVYCNQKCSKYCVGGKCDQRNGSCQCKDFTRGGPSCNEQHELTSPSQFEHSVIWRRAAIGLLSGLALTIVALLVMTAILIFILRRRPGVIEMTGKKFSLCEGNSYTKVNESMHIYEDLPGERLSGLEGNESFRTPPEGACRHADKRSAYESVDKRDHCESRDKQGAYENMNKWGRSEAMIKWSPYEPMDKPKGDDAMDACESVDKRGAYECMDKRRPYENMDKNDLREAMEKAGSCKPPDKQNVEEITDKQGADEPLDGQHVNGYINKQGTSDDTDKRDPCEDVDEDGADDD